MVTTEKGTATRELILAQAYEQKAMYEEAYSPSGRSVRKRTKGLCPGSICGWPLIRQSRNGIACAPTRVFKNFNAAAASCFIGFGAREACYIAETVALST